MQFVSVNKVANRTHNRNWDEQSFIDDRSIQKWNTNHENVNDNYNDFIWHLKGSIDRHAPLKKLSKKEIKLKNKPWITPYILLKIKHRNGIIARLKKNLGDAHLKASYKRFRNLVNKNIKHSMKNYYIWKDVNDIITKASTYKVTKTQLADDPKLVSETFNNFFVNVGRNLGKKIPSGLISPNSYLKRRVTSNFTLEPTSIVEVMTDILKLDDSKSSGPDNILVKLLKISAPLIVPHLVIIINKSFKPGIFPHALKLAKVIPIFKSGSKLDINNYRP